MKQIRTAIVGQGRSGRNIHAMHLKTDPHRFKIVAVAELLEERRQRAAEELGCAVYSDYKEMIKRDDIDLVINSSFSYSHVPVSMDIMDAGKHCICEKPFAQKISDADMMIKKAEEKSVLLTVFQQSRFVPWFEQVKEVIASGVLGRIIQISFKANGFARRYDWQTLQEYMGGNLLNTGPHSLDQALQLFGTGAVPEVHCFMDRVNSTGDAEDHVLLIIKGENRPIINLEISSCSLYNDSSCRIYGEYGSLDGNLEKLNWKYFDPGDNPPKKLTKTPLVNEKGLPTYCTYSINWIENSWTIPEEPDSPIARYYDALYDSIVHGAPLLVDPVEIRQQAGVIEECQRQNPQIYSPDSRESQ